MSRLAASSGGLRRLAAIHALNNAGEACFAVSLAGSLFFGVSVDAARPLILGYLLLTMAPFAIVLPLIAPTIDRVRGGQRGVILFTLLGRAVVLALLTIHLERLAFYPEAFTALVLGRTYLIAKAAMVPRVEHDPIALVKANSLISVVGAVGGTSGGAAAVALLSVTDAAWTLRMGFVLFLAAAATTASLPATRAVTAAIPVIGEELQSPYIRSAAVAMATLRVAVGFMTFHIAFSLKRAGAPLWIFGLALAAGAFGSFSGSLSAPALRRRTGEDRIIAIALVIPVAVAAIAALRFHHASAVAVAGSIGLAGALARHGFDSLVQRQAPEVDRGRAFSRFETWFQLTWVFGALIPVATRPSDWAGMLILTGILTYAAGAYLREIRALGHARAANREGGLVESLLHAAEASLLDGAGRRAIVIAATAAIVAVEVGNLEREPPDLVELRRLRDGAITDAAEPPLGRAERALILAHRVITHVDASAQRSD